MILAFLGFSAVNELTVGFPQRLDPETRTILAGTHDYRSERQQCSTSTLKQVDERDFCSLGASANTARFILWGDSHGETLITAADEAAKLAGATGVFAGRMGCAPLVGVERGADRCRPINDAIMAFILANPQISTVILSARWGIWAERTRYKSEEGLPLIVSSDDRSLDSHKNNHVAIASALDRTVFALVAAGKKVWLVGPTPEVGYLVPKSLYLQQKGFGTGTEVAPTFAEFESRHQFVFTVFKAIAAKYSVSLLWPHAALCDTEKCRVQVNGKPLYTDSNHLSITGARMASPMFAAVFQ